MGLRVLVKRSFLIVLVVVCLVVLSGINIQPVKAATLEKEAVTLVGPKHYSLSMGDSLSFGYQPDLDFGDGYATKLFDMLRSYGTEEYVNFACVGETTSTFMKGGCPFFFLRKQLYTSSQFDAVLRFLKQHPGEVSPVTFTIGANDILQLSDVEKAVRDKTCSLDWRDIETRLDSLTHTLADTVLPRLREAMTVNGKMAGDIFVLNYYDPLQNLCPESIKATQMLNNHLATAAADKAGLVDVFTAFGGAATPNPNTCDFLWICSVFHDIHPRTEGYAAIADAVLKTSQYEKLPVIEE